MVRLDWVSTEDSGHILTTGIGSRIFLDTQVDNASIIITKIIDDKVFSFFYFYLMIISD